MISACRAYCRSFAHDRVMQLGGLIAFWRIRVKIVFTVEHAFQADFGINGEAEFNGHAQGFFVKYRQYTRQAEINGTGLGIGVGTVGGGRAGENL